MMTIAGIVFGFVFDNPLGKWIVGGLGAVALFFGWLTLHDSKVAREARAAVYEASRIEGEKKNAKADEVHAAAERPGAADRLQRSACRDCR
jgi:hypothetical protein